MKDFFPWSTARTVSVVAIDIGLVQWKVERKLRPGRLQAELPRRPNGEFSLTFSLGVGRRHDDGCVRVSVMEEDYSRVV